MGVGDGAAVGSDLAGRTSTTRVGVGEGTRGGRVSTNGTMVGTWVAGTESCDELPPLSPPPLEEGGEVGVGVAVLVAVGVAVSVGVAVLVAVLVEVGVLVADPCTLKLSVFVQPPGKSDLPLSETLYSPFGESPNGASGIVKMAGSVRVNER